MREVVIVDGARSAFTNFGGSLRTLASVGALGNFVGMLTDSRSFLSYARHDYFRRILCSYLGEEAESGAYPQDEEMLMRLVRKICYQNTADYFGFQLGGE